MNLKNKLNTAEIANETEIRNSFDAKGAGTNDYVIAWSDYAIVIRERATVVEEDETVSEG